MNMQKPKQEFKHGRMMLQLSAEKLNGINRNTSLEAALGENERVECELTKLRQLS